jgi:hypothetical protein
MISMVGASILHGPQVGEKKSTITGFEAWSMNPGRVASSSSTGTAEAAREMAVLQLPHFGPRCCLSAGTLFFVEQFVQATTILFMAFSLLKVNWYFQGIIELGLACGIVLFQNKGSSLAG